MHHLMSASSLSVLDCLPLTRSASGVHVIGAGVHIYIYIHIMTPPKSLKRTLAVDLPFQTLTVDLSLNL